MFRATAKQQFESSEIAAAARQFKSDVQQGLESLLREELHDNESLPDLTFFQELIGRLLERNGNSLAQVDGRYSNELRSVALLRGERDELTEKLRLRMRDARYLLDSKVTEAAAKASLRERRFSGLKPQLLVGGARNLVAALRDPKLDLEQLSSDRTSPSAAALAVALETEANQLEQVLLLLTPQKKAKEAELGAKKAEVEAAAEKKIRCADALFGLYRLAGLDFHAERLRPKARSKKRGDEKMGDKAEPQPVMALMRIS